MGGGGVGVKEREGLGGWGFKKVGTSFEILMASYANLKEIPVNTKARAVNAKAMKA